MIILDVRINERQIATAKGVNISNLDTLSSYEVEVFSEASPVTGAKEYVHRFRITDHPREQSAWALVAKIAEEAARREEPDQT